MNLPTCLAAELDDAARPHRWLINELWADEAVGIVGGEPKCCKSFLALDMAVAVASGVPCLRRYNVERPGRVLLFAAEDALHVVRSRLEGICRTAGADFDALDVHVITAPELRLDRDEHRRALDDTVALLRPRLLILDPFVRLHRVDENASGDVAPLLGYLRGLQRAHRISVVLVHHARKGAASARAGQALRGSSEFHAWGDSNLYLRRSGDDIHLSVEHRAAASFHGPTLRLLGDDGRIALGPVVPASVAHAPPSLDDQIIAALRAGPHSQAQLRSACRVRTATICDALDRLATEERILKRGALYSLPTP